MDLLTWLSVAISGSSQMPTSAATLFQRPYTWLFCNCGVIFASLRWTHRCIIDIELGRLERTSHHCNTCRTVSLNITSKAWEWSNLQRQHVAMDAATRRKHFGFPATMSRASFSALSLCRSSWCGTSEHTSWPSFARGSTLRCLTRGTHGEKGRL